MKRLIVGIFAGAVLAVVALFGGTAIAGTGVGAVFNLGQTNVVDAQSVLNGATTGPLLKMTNSGGGTASTDMSLQVPAGHAPFTTNGTGRVVNLNADKLDSL